MKLIMSRKENCSKLPKIPIGNDPNSSLILAMANGPLVKSADMVFVLIPYSFSKKKNSYIHQSCNYDMCVK